MRKNCKLMLVVAMVAGLFIFIRPALAGYVAMCQAPVKLTIENYVYLNIHKDELVMTPITGADMGTKKWSWGVQSCRCYVQLSGNSKVPKVNHANKPGRRHAWGPSTCMAGVV